MTRWIRAFTVLAVGYAALGAAGVLREQDAAQAELPVQRVPNVPEAAEAYFSPDGRSLIGNARFPGDGSHRVYTMSLDGTRIQRINDRGLDACSFYMPDGARLLWTSTRDHPEQPPGNWSDPKQYPVGAELYSSDLKGGDVRRLTNNLQYDAEVSASPDGRWILFGRQTDGRMDLWRMRPDGSGETQITRTADWQEGGAFYMPDSETILYRAWTIEAEGKGRGMPMTIFTIRHDGSGLRQITTDNEMNWAPFPAPDGRHFVFVRLLPPGNFEVFLMNLDTTAQRRLTFNPAFDGFPSISPDGRMVAFSSGRDAPAGARTLALYTMDVSSLHLSKH